MENPLKEIAVHVAEILRLKGKHNSERAEMVDRLTNYADGVAAELNILFDEAGIPLYAKKTKKINSTEELGDTQFIIAIERPMWPGHSEHLGNLFSIDLPDEIIPDYQLPELGVSVYNWLPPQIMEGFEDRGRKEYKDLARYENLLEALADKNVRRKLIMYTYQANR